MAKDPLGFGPPTKATPPFPAAGSAMPRQAAMPPTPPPAQRQPPPPTGKPHASRHAPKHKAGRTKHQ